MRSYKNTKKTAIIRNLYTGKDFFIEFPATIEEQDLVYNCATCCGGHDYAIVDLEGFYGLQAPYAEYASIEALNDMAERIEALEDDDAEKLEAMAEYCDDLDDIESAWDDSYFIADTTMADYAQELCYECGYMPAAELPEWISCHIDWEGVGRELSVDGYSEINGGVLYVAK